MIVVGSCYFLLTLLIPYDPNIDFVFPLSFYIRVALPQIKVETLIGSQANYEIKIQITICFYKIIISYERYSTLNLY